MADPAATPAIPIGLAISAAAVGLDPALMVMGAAGALWAQFYLPEMPPLRRALSLVLGSVIAAWTAPAAVTLLPSVPGWPAGVTGDGFIAPAALLAGLFAHSGGGVLLRLLATRTGENS